LTAALAPGCILTWDESLLEADGGCAGCGPGLSCVNGTCVIENAVAEIGLGMNHSCAATLDEALWCWGQNQASQVGIDTVEGASVPRPTRVDGSGWTKVAGGYKGDAHTCAIRSDGSLWCWGDNGDGKLGVGDTSGVDTSKPLPVPEGSWLAVGLGDQYSCGLQDNGSLWCWGWGADNRLGGVGTTDVPGAVDQVQYTALGVGDTHACAIESDATLRCWGMNACLQLGRTTLEAPPTAVEELPSGWTAVAAGECHTCGIRGGVVHCFGDNTSGQLGLSPTQTQTSTPTPVGSDVGWELSGATDFVAVAAGGRHSCALRADHTLWCWGSNESGSLGEVASLGEIVPEPVRVPDEDWARVDAGLAHTCAVKLDGSLWCWGSASHQQLGLDDGQNVVSLPKRVTIGE